MYRNMCFEYVSDKIDFNSDIIMYLVELLNSLFNLYEFNTIIVGQY